jgi:hypothetical protein
MPGRQDYKFHPPPHKGVEKYPSIKQFQLSVMLKKHFFSFVSVAAA